MNCYKENCTLLAYYRENSGNSLPTFWDRLLVPSSRVKNPKKKDGADRLSQNVGNKLPLLSV